MIKYSWLLREEDCTLETRKKYGVKRMGIKKVNQFREKRNLMTGLLANGLINKDASVDWFFIHLMHT